MPPRLLVLSNGHGEDLIALRVLESLRRLQPELELSVLPLVGEGHAFQPAEQAGWLQRIGPRQLLPSGGFSNQSLRGLLRDLGAGLPLLSWRQWRLVRRWGRRGDPVLAVGDLLPLLLAWSGGGPYGFVGTPKSDYTWASATPVGWRRSRLADAYHRCKGSEWDPWEWRLMAAPRCRCVAVRDRLTARGLRRHGVRAEAPGNPMMDGFAQRPLPDWLAGRRRVLLLPGSRMPEALENLRRLLEALPPAGDEHQQAIPWTVLAATGARPAADELQETLQAAGFQPIAPPVDSGARSSWRRGSLEVLVGPGCFANWASWSEVGLATAGTATEQLVGLGVPALSLPGAGPQFKAGFAVRQSRLLGGAVQPCHRALELRQRLTVLLGDSRMRRHLGGQGRRRMGPAGGASRLAELIATTLLAATLREG